MKRVLTLCAFFAMITAANAADFVTCQTTDGDTIITNSPPPGAVCKGTGDYTPRAPVMEPVVSGAKSALALSNDFKNDILTLLKITGTENIGNQMGTAITNQIVDSFSKQNNQIPQRAVAAVKDEINKIVKEELPRLLAELVPLYAKHFTQREVKSLMAFYKTPLGKKSIKIMPAIMNDSMLAGQAWGEGLTAKLQSRIEARLKKEGY